jgi:hypothetical protein
VKQFSIKKFFVKHTKIIMTLVSVALMFIFALPTFRSPTQSDRDKAAAGFLDGKKVSNDDLAFARGELALLREFLFLQQPPSWIERFAGDDSQANLYWYLICNEAARYTYVNVTPDEAVKMAVENLKREKPGISDGDVDQMLEGRAINRITLARVVSKLQMVYRYQNFLVGMPESVAWLELAADRELRRIQVQYVPVNAIEGWDQPGAEVVSADQMAAQFEAYKNVLRTPILAAPEDPPVFLGLEADEKGEYALLGYPGAVDAALHLHEREVIPWDGSRIERILHQGDFLGVGSGGIVTAPYNTIIVSGGGRVGPTQVYQGLDIHDRLPSALPPEINGHRFPFGYKVPDRVKVEYLVFKFADLRKRMEATKVDVEAAFKVFQANPYKFRPEAAAATAPAAPAISVAPPTATEPAATQGASSQPATRSAKDIQNDWNDLKVKEPYISEQVDIRCARLLKNMVDAARSRAEAPWKGDNVPQSDSWVAYETIAADLSKDAMYLGYQPEPCKPGADFLGPGDLRRIPGIGQAIFSDTQGQMFEFAALATNIEDLVYPEVAKRLAQDLKKEPTADEIRREVTRQPLGRRCVPLGEETAEVTDKDGNMYLFRVRECQAAHVPASLDDVTAGQRKIRDDVAADCRKLAAFQQRVKALQTAIAGGDLEAVARQYQSKVQYPKEFNRDPAQAPVDLQYIRDFVTTAFKLPEPAADKPPSVKVLEDDELLKAYAMKVVRILPTSGADFAAERVYLYRQTDPESMRFLQDYLQIENVAQRLKFKPVQPFVKRTSAP